MKYCISIILSIFISLSSLAQIIEGDQLLDLLDKPTTGQLFQDLKKQETFYTDAWDEDFTVYINNTDHIIKEVELENGKLRYGSTDRYGHYQRKLPLGLTWNMTVSDFSAKLGTPYMVSTSMHFSDYNYSKDLLITVYYENDKPVSISFKKRGASSTMGKTSPVTQPPAAPLNNTNKVISPDWLIKLNGENEASLNWSAFVSLLNNFNNQKVFAGKDSVDYIGEVYYNSILSMTGFDRVAVKRRKKDNKWYFEGFFKMDGDTNKVKNTFFGLYDGLKNTIKKNAGDDFILASSAKKAISESPMNWMAQWSLYTNYRSFSPGIGKVRVMLLLSGMKKFMKDEMEYTFKFYVFDDTVNANFFTWDTPK